MRALRRVPYVTPGNCYAALPPGSGHLHNSATRSAPKGHDSDSRRFSLVALRLRAPDGCNKQHTPYELADRSHDLQGPDHGLGVTGSPEPAGTHCSGSTDRAEPGCPAPAERAWP